MPSASAPPESMTAPPRAELVDAAARQLTGSFLAGLLLIVPMRAALATTAYGALYGWLGVAAVIVVLFGLLLRLAGVPHALGLTLSTAGAFAVAALVTLSIVAEIGDPGSHTSVAMFAGIPAAAIAAPAAASVVRWAKDETGAMALGAVACVIGLFLAATAGSSIGQWVNDARDDAERIRGFEEAGLTPYLPEIDGARAEFSSTSSVRPENGASQLVGYSLRYEPDSASAQDYDSANISVDIGLAVGVGCEPIEGHLECRATDGYVVTERDGVAEAVSCDRGDMRLRAILREGTGELPDIDVVGRALAGADESEWEKVLDASG